MDQERMWKVPENCSTFVYHDSSTTGQTKFLESTRIEMTPEEAVILYKKIPAFKSENGRMPDINSRDFNEKRMAESLIYLNKLRQERANANA